MPINLKARKNTLSLICAHEHKLSNSCAHLQTCVRFQTEWQTALRVPGPLCQLPQEPRIRDLSLWTAAVCSDGSLQAWMRNLCSHQSFQRRGSEVRKTTRYSVKGGGQGEEAKMKIEILARHDQMDHNIRVDRHPKQKTIINQHMHYLKESNHILNSWPPLYVKIHKSTSFSVRRSLPLSDHWSWNQRTSFSVLDQTLMIIAVHFQNL